MSYSLKIKNFFKKKSDSNKTVKSNISISKVSSAPKKTLLHFFSFTILEVSGAYQFRTAKNGLTFLRDFACVTSNPH